jgi:hypothetical protein
VSAVRDWRQRRLGRRYQRWSEVDPLDDYGRRAAIGTGLALAFFLAVVGLFVVGLVFAR